MAQAYSAPQFTVYNEGYTTIEQLYVSPSGNSSWDGDLLGSYVLSPGYHYHPLEGLYLPSCYQDVRAIYADGYVAYDWDVDVCDYNVEFYH